MTDASTVAASAPATPPALLEPQAVDVCALGVVVRILVNRPALVPAVEHAWAQCLAPDLGEPVATVTLRESWGTDERAVAESLRDLTQQVTGAAIRARAGELLMFHAGGLSHQQTGASIAFVAPGGTGKTTLVRTLGAGRGYLSDETIAVAADGSVVPYAKPLSVRRPEAPNLKDEIPPADLGLELPQAPPWLAGLIMLRRDSETGGQVEVTDIGLLDALVLLAPETSSMASLGSPLRTAADLVESVGGVRLVRYRDATDLEPIVRDVLGRVR